MVLSHGWCADVVVNLNPDGYPKYAPHTPIELLLRSADQGVIKVTDGDKHDQNIQVIFKHAYCEGKP